MILRELKDVELFLRLQGYINKLELLIIIISKKCEEEKM